MRGTPERRPRVLLVDDCVTSLLVEEYLLAGLPCDVLKATRGEEALKLLAEYHVDLVILDLVMPGMDGLETLRRLRAQAGPELPVVVVSVRGDRQREVRQVGATGYLTKPVDQSVLLGEVRRLLSAAATLA